MRWTRVLLERREAAASVLTAVLHLAADRTAEVDHVDVDAAAAVAQTETENSLPAEVALHLLST